MRVSIDEINRDEVRDLVQKWKGKQGSLIMVLHDVQERHGYIPRDLALEISQELGIPLARIYEVITFYNLFKLTPPAKHVISVCLGTACYLNGAPDILSELKNILHVEEEETTDDGQFQLNTVRCLGCCGLSPVMMIDDKVYGKVKKSEIMEIISKWDQEVTNVKNK